MSSKIAIAILSARALISWQILAPISNHHFISIPDAVGVIDDTHIAVNVPVEDQARYRNRKDIEGQRPQNGKELFNFWHSSLRNAVERTIGLLKKRFAYLRHQPFHDISTQAKIVLACCAIHNFLRIDDAENVYEEDFDSSDDEVNPTHADVPEEETINAHISFTAKASWSNNRNEIVQSIWVNHNLNADAEIEFD
ncbi:putative nuclease HARBI1 [Abeliophyllum distichum]|uniref:Nuclease HARBI1 n=1 Tax=Abeliophyllum distichum TaxID=126358 RepID=A0ABD1V3N6_9LAMI